jgi:hypothetical protein
MLGDNYGFDCPITLYHDYIITPIMYYLGIL